MSELYYNITGQYLTHDADLTPTAVTSVTVYEATDSDDADGLSATTGSASIDSASTTLLAAYDPNQADPTSLTVASSSGFSTGKRYIITAAAGDYEHFECVDVGTGTIKIKNPLLNAYAVTTTTVNGLRISIAVNATWIADANYISPYNTPYPRYRVRWVYTAGGVTVVQATDLDVVRYVDACHVSPLDVEVVHPGWLYHLPSRQRTDQGRGLIAAAWNEVWLDCAGDAHSLGRLRSAKVKAALVIEKTNAMAQRIRFEGGGGSLDIVTGAEDLYMKRYNQLIRSPGSLWDEDGSGASATTEKAAFFRR